MERSGHPIVYRPVQRAWRMRSRPFVDVTVLGGAQADRCVAGLARLLGMHRRARVDATSDGSRVVLDEVLRMIGLALAERPLVGDRSQLHHPAVVVEARETLGLRRLR